MSTDTNRLRLELLRMRATIEREELAAAVTELRSRTVTLRRVAGVANRLGTAMNGSSPGALGWLAQAAGAFDQRPWVPLVIAGAARLAKHRPWTVALTLGALLVVARARRAAQHSNESQATRDE
jgi:hypothetical protein